MDSLPDTTDQEHQQIVTAYNAALPQAGGDKTGFVSQTVKFIKKGINNLSTNEVKRAPPISPEDIKMVVNFLASADPTGEVLSSAFLLAYFSLTRQSSYTSPSLDVWGGTHTIRRKDVVATKEGLCPPLRSTKTIKRYADAVPLLIPRIIGSPYCPVRAWYQIGRASCRERV